MIHHCCYPFVLMDFPCPSVQAPKVKARRGVAGAGYAAKGCAAAAAAAKAKARCCRAGAGQMPPACASGNSQPARAAVQCAARRCKARHVMLCARQRCGTINTAH